MHLWKEILEKVEKMAGSNAQKQKMIGNFLHSTNVNSHIKERKKIVVLWFFIGNQNNTKNEM